MSHHRTKIIFLGTGTSIGVPIIGCRCEVCTSNDLRNHRLRCSVMVQTPLGHFVIDTGPDFRQQMLRYGIDRLDAILYTHHHQDHIIGMDDVRPFNIWQRKTMPIYSNTKVQEALKGIFAYAFTDPPYPGSPNVQLHTIDAHTPFEIAPQLSIQPIEVIHGNLPILGFRVGDFTYITDASHIADHEIAKIKGSEVVVLNALRHEPHWSHFSLEQAIAVAQQIGAPYTYFTHISHQLGLHHTISQQLPPNCYLAYDGLTLLVD